MGSNPSLPPFIEGRKIIPLCPPGQLPARRALQLGERPLPPGHGPLWGGAWVED